MRANVIKGQVGAGCMPAGYKDLQYQGPGLIRDKIKSHKAEVQNITQEMNMGYHNKTKSSCLPTPI